MKKSFLIILSLITCISLHSQNLSLVKFKICGNAIEGIIFPNTYIYNGHLVFDECKSRFTPTLLEVKHAEIFLMSNNSKIEYIDMGSLYKPRDLHKILKTFRRQYVGYINNSEDSIIVIHALNFKERGSKKAFDDWGKNYIIAYDGFYENNMVTFSINLTKHIVSIP